MKKLLIIVVAVVAVFGIGYLSIAHYKNYQNKQKTQGLQLITVKQADQHVKDVIRANDAEYKGLVAQYNNAVAECQKGVTAYAKLTANLKLQTAPPVCPAPQK